MSAQLHTLKCVVKEDINLKFSVNAASIQDMHFFFNKQFFFLPMNGCVAVVNWVNINKCF